MKDMPQMGMGTFRLEGEEARVSASKALDVGFRHIDTAQFYDNEAQVGDAIRLHCASAATRLGSDKPETML